MRGFKKSVSRKFGRIRASLSFKSRSGEERKRNKNLSLHSIPQQGVSDDGQAEREQGHVDPKKTVIVSHGASNFSTSTSSLEQGEHCADVSPDSVPHPLQDQFTTGASSSIDSSDPGDVCDNQLSTTPQSQEQELKSSSGLRPPAAAPRPSQIKRSAAKHTASSLTEARKDVLTPEDEPDTSEDETTTHRGQKAITLRVELHSSNDADGTPSGCHQDSAYSSEEEDAEEEAAYKNQLSNFYAKDDEDHSISLNILGGEQTVPLQRPMSTNENNEDLPPPDSCAQSHNNEFGEFEINGKVLKLRVDPGYRSSRGNEMAESMQEFDSPMDKVPDSLRNEIIRLCDEHAVDFCEITQRSDQSHQINVFGKNASAIQADIDKYTQKVSPSFQVVTHEVQEYLWYHEYQRSTRYNQDMTLRVCKLTYSDIQHKWEQEASAACELVLIGTNKKSSRAHDTLYVAFPAHLALDKPKCLKLLENNKDTTISNIRETLLYGEALFELHMHNRSIPLELIKPPMLAYEHYYTKTGLKCDPPHTKFMKDMAVARIDGNKMSQDDKTEIINSLKERTTFERKAKKVKIYDEVLSLTIENLKCMAQRGVQFRVGLGARIPAFLFNNKTWDDDMDSKVPGRRIRATRLEFCTQYPLVAGQCGILVYMEGGEDDIETLYPVAMFVGEAKDKPESGENVYQAVLLQPNIEDIEAYYYKEVTNLRIPPNARSLSPVRNKAVCETDVNANDSGFESLSQANN